MIRESASEGLANLPENPGEKLLNEPQEPEGYQIDEATQRKIDLQKAGEYIFATNAELQGMEAAKGKMETAETTGEVNEAAKQAVLAQVKQVEAVQNGATKQLREDTEKLRMTIQLEGSEKQLTAVVEKLNALS